VVRLWIKTWFLRRFLGVRFAQIGPHHHRMTYPEKRREIALRAIEDVKASAWRNGVEPIVTEDNDITKIVFGGKTIEIMIIPTEPKN
jgi:hypothetical protein